MALGDAKSGRDVDPTLRPDSRLAFRRLGRQTHGAHRTQGIIFAVVSVASRLMNSLSSLEGVFAIKLAIFYSRADISTTAGRILTPFVEGRWA